MGLGLKVLWFMFYGLRFRVRVLIFGLVLGLSIYVLGFMVKV